MLNEPTYAPYNLRSTARTHLIYTHHPTQRTDIYLTLTRTSHNMDMSASTIAYFIDHLFLPPRIGASSRVNNKSELNLVSFVHEAVSQFQAGGILASPMAIERIDRIVKMLGVMAELQALPPGSNELQLSLMKAFMGMEEGGMYTFDLFIIFDYFHDPLPPYRIIS